MKHTTKKRPGSLLLAALGSAFAWLGGCATETTGPGTISFHLESYGYSNPLSRQQLNAYPECATGRFESLADFETAEARNDQAAMFRVVRPVGGQPKACRTVLSPSRTGSASLEAQLSPGEQLDFRPLSTWSLDGYKLLSMAVYIDHPRSDLRITLRTTTGQNAASGLMLLRPGWNTVMMELPESSGASTSRLSAVHLQFEAAEEAITLHLDDILLIDNTRTVANAPEGMMLIRSGLGYRLGIPAQDREYELSFDPAKLSLLEGLVFSLSLSQESHFPSSTDTEGDLSLMGSRRLSVNELIEANALRIRLRSSWYFPPEIGRWVDMEVRRIIWDYSFYRDGRVIVGMLIDNVGGSEIGAARLIAPSVGCWSNGHISRQRIIEDIKVPVLHAAVRLDISGDESSIDPASFGGVARVNMLQGRWASVENPAGEPVASPWNPTEGCYEVQAELDVCRFQLIPASEPSVRPVIKIMGEFDGEVSASCNGLAIRPVVRLDDGVLIMLNETLRRPALIEVRGRVIAHSPQP